MTSEDDWVDDLAPIKPADWNRARARHLLNRAGFGGTPEDIDRLAAMTPAAAVAAAGRLRGRSRLAHLPAFEHSGVYDPTLQVFPPSRPAATRKAETTGEAIGVRVKPGGTRRVQPVVDRFFYWLRATALETRRVAAWWADRMVRHRPAAAGEDGAVLARPFRHRRRQGPRLSQDAGPARAVPRRRAPEISASFWSRVAQDPAMLVFLDAGQNVKGAPNENFGREVMELFTMGVGNYSETRHPRGGARLHRLDQRRSALQASTRPSTMTARRYSSADAATSTASQILNIILAQKVTANFIAGKIYRFFVRDDLSPDLQKRLGAILRENDYELKPLLRTIFLSRDFYSEPSVGTRIKGPVDLIVSMCRELGVKRLPGVPDFNSCMRRARSGAAQSADRRRLGAGTQLDHAWHVAGARQFRARDAAAGHDQFRRSQPRSGRRRFARSTTASCGGCRSRQRPPKKIRGTGMAERQSHGQRPRRQGGLQYALRQPQRLARGGSQGEAHIARARAVQPVDILSSRRNRKRRPRSSTSCSAAFSACRWPKNRGSP